MICSLIAMGAVGSAHDGARAPGAPISGRFDGEGLITIGCSLWYESSLYEYGGPIAKEDDGFLYVHAQGNDETGLRMTIGVDSREGFRLVSGTACGASIDFSVFPDPEEVER